MIEIDQAETPGPNFLAPSPTIASQPLAHFTDLLNICT